MTTVFVCHVAMSVLCLDPQNRCSFAPSHRIQGQVACLRAYRASDSSQDAPRPPTHSQALLLTTCSLSHKRLSLIVQHLNIHPTSTKLRQDLDQRKKEKEIVHDCHQILSNHRPSHDLPRRRTLPSLPLLANFSILKSAAISMPPPRRPALFTSHNQHPPSTASAQPL